MIITSIMMLIKCPISRFSLIILPLSLILTLTFSMLKPCPTFSQEILILQGGRVGPFEETINGLKLSVKSPVKVVDVVDINQRIPLCDYKIVVALGSRSVASMKKNYCDGSNYLYALVLSPSELKVDNFDHFIGINPSPSFDGAIKALYEKNKDMRILGVIYTKSSEKFLEPLRNSSSKFGIGVYSERIESVGEIEVSLETTLKGINAFFILPDPVLLEENIILYLLKALKKREIYIIAPYKALLSYGADMAYAFDFVELGKEMGELMENIIKGNLKGPQMIFIKGSVFIK